MLSVCFVVIPEGIDSPVGVFQIRSLEAAFVTAEWGFAIGSPYWGSGLFANAARLVLDFAFGTVGVRRLEARACAENRRGNGALRKLGATPEGVLRRSFLWHGKYHDQVLWSILDCDWAGSSSDTPADRAILKSGSRSRPSFRNGLPMKTEFTDVSETQKTITIEIPTEVVDAEIDRIARGYTKQARLPGFRPGKVPQTIVKQRFKDQILHDVMHGLIPRAVEEALQERGIEPVDTPNIKDVALEEGQPLKFTAAVETVPAFDPGDLSAITLHRPPVEITDDAVNDMLQRLRERAGKFEPVEGRPVADGDAVVADLDRTGPDGKDGSS